MMEKPRVNSNPDHDVLNDDNSVEYERGKLNNGDHRRRSEKVTNNGRYYTSHSDASCRPTTETLEEKGSEKQTRFNKAVEAYLQRAKEYDIFIKEQEAEFEKGKVFLAKIMGKDPNTFTQNNIDDAIQYLFPSGLHEPKARPMLKHPSILYAKRKEAQFDSTGRPHHFLFYTAKPNFSQVLHDCSKHLHNLNEKLRRLGPSTVHPKVPLNVVGSVWMTKQQLEAKMLENLLDVEYEKFIEAMERLTAHPYSFEVASFIMEFREKRSKTALEFRKPKTIKIGDNVFAVDVEECRRKSCKGTVRLINPGTGKITINGKSLIDFFEELMPRQEVSFSF